MIEALRIHVKGVVQGVGFRPFVYRLAQTHHINGWVYNATEGVFIHAEGAPEDLDTFALALAQKHPVAAQVKEVNLSEVPVEHFSDFTIQFSHDDQQAQTTLVSPDLATCDECVAELFNPHNRRFHYPFINCTNCGPRFTIMKRLPYDRPQTSMALFTMCDACQTEYDNPADRRFHAQPNACFECGPALGWITAFDAQQQGIKGIAWAQNREESDAFIDQAVTFLREGKIVAVKGLGGYHLVCDAANPQALARLRERKHREGKAFAVMVATVEDARLYCQVNEEEQAQLTSPARPIVLLRKKRTTTLAPGLADHLPELGVMLPTTPVQHLLVQSFGGMLVMTSGNLHDEPIVTTEDAALSQLGEIADAFLVNNRPIESRYDDSVIRVINASGVGEVVQVIRRARGLAPLPLEIPAPKHAYEVFATGPEQKNTMTFVRDGQAFVSQHIGDMENVSVLDAWEDTRLHYQTLFRLHPQRIVCDKHPEYLTSKWAHQCVQQQQTLIEAQHHHAHILAVMGENQLEGPVCGIAFDGTGYGEDGAIWGGEVLLCNLQAFERFANFAYIPLLGGAAAIKEPARIAYGALWEFDLLEHPQAQAFVQANELPEEVYEKMIERGINTPLTSSVGRLFDAVSALLGICLHPRYEGEAAILLEAMVHAEMPDESYTSDSQRYALSIIKNTASDASTAQDTSVVLFDAAPTFKALLDDLAQGVSVGTIARRFHDAMVQAIVMVAEVVRMMYDINTVALSGGVFMNRYLMEHALKSLQEKGFTVAINRDLPPNDASISYGQAVLGLHSSKE